MTLEFGYPTVFQHCQKYEQSASETSRNIPPSKQNSKNWTFAKSQMIFIYAVKFWFYALL